MTFISFRKLYTLYEKFLFEFLLIAWDVSFLTKLQTLFVMKFIRVILKINVLFS